MVKGISAISSYAKAGVLGLLLMGAGSVYASNPLRDVNKTPNQTEVVSREGAEALKSTALQSVQGVKQDAVPTTHNKRIDNALLKYDFTENEKKEVNSVINYLYKENGTFLASALLQHEINCQQLDLFMDAKTNILITNNINPTLGEKIKNFGEDFYKTVTPAKNDIYKWAINEYTPYLMNLFNFDHKPTFKEVSMKLDFIIDKELGLNTKEIVDFYKKEGEFRQKTLNNRQDDMAKSEIIAYKMFLIDSIVFERSLKNLGVFGRNSFENGSFTLKDYFQEWMNSANPNNK